MAGRTSIPALLVAVGAPRLRRSGIDVPRRRLSGAEHRLYALLARSDPDSAHSRYNALIRRLVSFERAIEYAASGRGNHPHLHEGGSACSEVDILMIPEDEHVFRELPNLKGALELNIKLASPADFILGVAALDLRQSLSVGIVVSMNGLRSCQPGRTGMKSAGDASSTFSCRVSLRRGIARRRTSELSLFRCTRCSR